MKERNNNKICFDYHNSRRQCECDMDLHVWSFSAEFTDEIDREWELYIVIYFWIWKLIIKCALLSARVIATTENTEYTI